MKPTSPLSLLLFLSLTTAAPIPTFSTLHRDCLRDTTCQTWLRDSFSPANDHTPPTRLTAPPHFLDHQLDQPSEEEVFNNAPLTPPKNLPPTLAVSALRPLHSSYLLSISNSFPSRENAPDQPSSSASALPSKPTSALPRLRAEDTLRYWATIPSHSENEDRSVVEEARSSCARPIVIAREYSDLLVVSIVVLFLAAVVVMEAVEYFGDLRSAILRRGQRRGEIFLSDDEGASSNKPISVRSVPTRYKTDLGAESKDAEKGEYHD